MGASQAKRAACAVLFMLALVGAVPMADMLAKGMHVARVGGSGVWRTLSADFASKGFEGALGDEGAKGVEGLPEGFLEEFPVAAFAGDYRTAEEGLVVSFAMQGGCAQALDRFVSCMEEEGWEASSGASVYGVTFTKEGGRYRWVFASMTEASNRTIVVLQGLSVV